MKITKVDKKAVFESIELTITIENLDEFRALWHRLNIPADVIRRHSSIELSMPSKFNSTETLWRALNDIAIQRRLRNDH